MKKATTVDEYIASFPETIQQQLNEVRQAVTNKAPDAVEGIAYGMPGYKLNGKPLVYFGGFTSHIGFYATPSGHEAFSKELSNYKQGKGSVQFPADQPMPINLIERMVEFRVQENLAAKKK